ncbi:spore coat U domain-containing protein [Brucella sp. 21LCYQ03]|nr:spore coat U domain-containing protein [Brucella sp. 21LCYQ03]
MKQHQMKTILELLHIDTNSAVSSSVKIALSLSLFIPVMSGSIFLQTVPAAASGGVCVLKNLGTFGNTVIDIVSNSAASATSEVQYQCTSAAKFDSVQFCTYLKAMDGNRDNTSNIFYQKHEKNARLGWRMALASDPNIPLANYDVSGSTAGWTHFANWSPTNQSTIATQRLMLTYLDRQQQDRVSSGVYNGAYQLVTKYKFINGVTSSCASGIADADGTIISDFNATATVTKNCQMENFQDIDFGKQSSIDIATKGENLSSAFGNIGVRCTYETPYSISINAGSNSENGISRLKSNNNFLPYKLYQEGCKTPWDDKSVRSGIGNDVNVITNHQVCAKFVGPLAAAPAAGTYTDTVIVTATF